MNSVCFFRKQQLKTDSKEVVTQGTSYYKAEIFAYDPSSIMEELATPTKRSRPPNRNRYSASIEGIKMLKMNFHNGKSSGTCLGLPTGVPIRIHLLPYESQPSSSTRSWIIKFHRVKPFQSKRKCKIVQQLGSRVSEPFYGKVAFREGDCIIIRGTLPDGAPEGEEFKLILTSDFSEEDLFEQECILKGALERGSPRLNKVFEATHDAYIDKKLL